MTIEQEARRSTPQVTSLDADLAEAYVERTLPHVRPEHAHRENRYTDVIYAHRPEPTLGKDIGLKVRYAETGGAPKRHMYFSYFAPSKDATHPPIEVATMMLEETDPGVFILVHRFVDPERRENGMGSRLLAQVESWLEQIATVYNEPVTLRASIAQAKTLLWFNDRGYIPEDEDSALLLKELITFPERFTDGGSMMIHGIEQPVYRADEEGERMGERVSVVLRKVFPPSHE